MVSTNPYDTYKKNAVTTASPGELTLMLYDGCITNIRKAKHGIQDKNLAIKSEGIVKAQAILRELQITLRPDIEVSQSMNLLYDYMNQRLNEANLANDIEILEEVEGFATEFRDTWKQAIQMNRAQQPAGGDMA